MTTSVCSVAHERDIRTPDGRQLHVYEAGDPRGDLILVHHGTPGSGLLWDRWAEDAGRSGIRLVGYDRPGYGLSDRHAGRAVADAATDAAAIADACGVARFRTWGGSGGGPHALACAALLHDRIIAAATLASVAPYDAEALDWFAGMGQDNLDEFGAALAGEAALRAFLAAVSPQIVAAGPDGLVEAMQSLLPAVDAAVLDGELARSCTSRGLRPAPWCRWVAGRRPRVRPPVGLRRGLDHGAALVGAGAPGHDGSVQPRPVAREPHPERHRRAHRRRRSPYPHRQGQRLAGISDAACPECRFVRPEGRSRH